MPSANESHAPGAAAGKHATAQPTALVRKLGSVDVPTYLERVLTQDGEHQFVVVERLSSSGMTEDEASESARDARMAASLEHPNVARTCAITVRPGEISVTSDYVAGERLSDLWRPAPGTPAALPLAIALRILVDVATGLGALHKLRVAEGQERVKFVHGEVTGENVLVGLDGVSMLLRAARARRRGALPKTGIGSLAPEILAGEAADQRADVYSLGALLWQALSGRPLFPDNDAAAILASVRQGTTVAPVVATKDASWAAPLADVAARALAPLPEKRFPTASSMVTELRKIAGAKMATAIQVAEFVEASAGTKIAARLAGVQASAVIRKAPSIPAPRSTPVPPPTIVERAPESAPKPTKVAAVVSPTADAAPRYGAPQAPLEPQAPPPASRRIETARSVALEPPPPPPPPPPSPPPAQTRFVPAARTAEQANPNALEPAKTAATPKITKATPERARAPVRPRVVTPAPLAVLAAEPAPAFLQRRSVRWAAGAWLAIALITGWLAWQAIRNRQTILTPATAPVETSAMFAPSASEALDVPAAAPRAASRAVPTQVLPTPTARARPATSEPRKPPPPKPRQK